MMKQKTPLIEIKGVHKSFKKAERQDLHVLENIDFTLHEGEIVAMLGKSGSGKSTLLRIISGLIAPSSGEVAYCNKPVHEPVPGISMVFQQFALMPWLTVLQNVELGLEALNVPRAERRKRALKAIDTIGLDGFESAFPKELSGGMQQRVGFARALVVDPDVLLMDEPFSALDVLTAENLRTDLLDLWEDKQTRIKGIFLVTHSIEEAAMMADRIIIFDSDPGRIRSELSVKIPHPRHEQEEMIRKTIDEVYQLMTTPTVSEKFRTHTHQVIGIGYRLPDVELTELTGLIEELASVELESANNLGELAECLHLDIDDLFSLVEILDILRFAIVAKGAIELTKAGKAFADADILQKKTIFSHHLLNYVPLARHIRRVLDDRPGHRAKKERFLNELEDHLSETEAERVLTCIIDWGRYAEVLAYDSSTQELSLENPK